MKLLQYECLVMLITGALSVSQASVQSEGLPTIAEQTSAFQKLDGYFNCYWDAQEGRFWLEVDKWNTEFLYVNSLPAGIGSNDIGLDRGEIGHSRVVRFQRVGPRVLLVEPNYRYRAMSDNPAERQSVEQAFAQSVLWGFEIAAESGERVLVDATSFYLRDAHDVVGTLEQKKQGSYSLEPSRSAFYLERTRNFPRNTEVEVTLTFVGNSPGRWLRSVVPTPRSVTVRQHYSFVQLPDENYRPRAFDPRAGFSSIRYNDYASAISEPLVKRFISRHRLNKKDPSAAVSEAVEPIVYYVDPGAPEPIRSALVEGASWWNEAFEAIGYKDAFQVKILPEDADPMDVRYNLIQWVHRSTRGWSYGGGVVDPRTGELIKGHVSLGSLRVRQDYLIAAGLLAPYEEGKPVSKKMEDMALARLQQLSAHEVGHTLGLSHNFAASVANRASVMDYPHPFVTLKSDGSFDFSAAYGVGVGAWDKAAIAYGYQDFPDDVNEAEALQGLIQKHLADGLIFITDQDARPAGGAHPLAHLWDNGTDAAKELDRLMQVRAAALDHFSERNIAVGAPFATLEEALVPIYMAHRYQVDATSKLLGGLFYTYAMRGDGQKVTGIVPPDHQRRALQSLLATLAPEVLALPERVLRLVPPRPVGYARGRENFKIRTGVTFDPLAAAETAANETVRFLLHPARAGRLVEYHARDNHNPGLLEVIEQLLAATWRSDQDSGYHAEIHRVVNNIVLLHLVRLAADTRASTQVQAIARLQLEQLDKWLQREKPNSAAWRAHFQFASARLERFLKDPDDVELMQPIEPPAGSPIGRDFGASCSWQ